MVKPEDLEVVEEYVLEGEKRFRLRIKGTSIYLNVAADSAAEAVKRAIELAERLELERIVSLVREG